MLELKLLNAFCVMADKDEKFVSLYFIFIVKLLTHHNGSTALSNIFIFCLSDIFTRWKCFVDEMPTNLERHIFVPCSTELYYAVRVLIAHLGLTKNWNTTLNDVLV